MKVYINRMPVQGPWGGGNIFVSAFHKRAPLIKDVELLLDETLNVTPDVILLAGLDNDGYGISVDQAVMYKLYVKPDVKIVDDLLVKVSAHIDGTIFVSNWLRDYFNERGWACANQAVIVNGVAADIFAPQPKLNDGKLNIVAHHWSDNPMKGADIYEQLDALVGEQPDRFAFTYIGRHKCDFKHTKVIRPLAGKALGEELGKHDVYVSASRFDPGPNHIAEAIACGLPTYVHAGGGGCVEFAGTDHIYHDWNELKALLVNGQFTPNSTAFSGWSACIEQYIKFLAHTLKS